MTFSAAEWDALSLKGKLEALARLPEETKRQDEVRKALEALSYLKAENPLSFFEPYPKQQAFLASRARTKAFFGGNRAGKTEIGVVDNLIQCVDRDCLPEHLQRFKRWEPPFYCRIVSPKFGVNEGVILEKLRNLIPRSQLIKGEWAKSYSDKSRKLHLQNGSWIMFNTGDQDVDVHAGVRLHRVHFDEEPEGERGWAIYRENRMRLMDFAPESQMVFTMTPLFGLSWTYDEVWEKRPAESSKGIYLSDDVACVVASMLDNPHINKAEIEREFRDVSDEERRARLEGQFVHFHGRVLDVRDEHICATPDAKHVQGLDCYVSIDPGIRRGGVLWGGFDRDNRLLIFDELYPENKTVPEIAAAIHRKNAQWGISPLYVIDPSARNRTLVNAESVEGEFQRQGIYPQHGQNDRLASVLQLRSRLQRGGLLIAQSCTNLRFELNRWLVAKDEDTEQQKAKVKGAGGSFATIGPDHLADNLRYLAMTRLWHVAATAGRPRERWVPGRAPSARWLVGGAPQVEAPPMGSMS